MIRTIPITKARGNLGEVIKRVHLDKDSFVLEKGGVPVAAILDIAEFEDWLETIFLLLGRTKAKV
jgi:prevent-host-death family protein